MESLKSGLGVRLINITLTVIMVQAVLIKGGILVFHLHTQGLIQGGGALGSPLPKINIEVMTIVVCHKINMQQLFTRVHRA